MKIKKSKENKKNPLNELDNIKLKDFKEIENEDLDDFNLDNFKKSRLDEFKSDELENFKNFVEGSKTDRSIENIKLELKSDEELKNTLIDLEEIGINGEITLKLLEKIKKGYI